MPLMGERELTDEEYHSQQKSEYTAGEAASASFDLAQMDTAVLLGARASMVNEFNQKGVTLIQPEEANKRYPNMPTKFIQPVNPYIAQMMSDREEEKAQLERAVELGPQDVWTKAKNFGAGIMAHMMDPVEFGVSALVGWGTGGVMTKVAPGLMGTAVKTGAQRLAAHSLEAVSGNLIENTALEVAGAHVATKEGEQYDPVQGMKNVAVSTFFGSIFGIGLKEGIHAAFGAKTAPVKGLETPEVHSAGEFQIAVDPVETAANNRAARFLKNTSPEADIVYARANIAAAIEGREPQIDLLAKTLAQETDVTEFTHPGKVNYSYEPMTHENVKGRKLYLSADDVHAFTPENARMIGEEHGIGVQLSDNPYVANAAANRAMADSKGMVWEVSADNIVPLDLNKPIPLAERGLFEHALKGVFPDPNEAVLKMSGKDLLESLWQAIDSGKKKKVTLTQLQNSLRDYGYNSFVQDGTRNAGFDHSPHNLVTVFDHSILEPQRALPVDPEIRRNPLPQEVMEAEAGLTDVRNSAIIEPELLKQMEAETIADDALTMEDLMGEVDDKEFFAQFDQMKENGEMTPELAKQVEAVKQLDADAELEHTTLLAALNCVGG